MENFDSDIALPSAPTLLKDAWNLYMRRFRLFFGIVLTAFVLISLGVTIIQKLFFPFPLPFLVGGQYLVIFIILIISFIFVSTWAKLALLYAISNEEIKHLKDAYLVSWQRILPFLGLSILIGIIIAGGFILFVIPGIIFLVWLCFSAFIFVEDKTSIFQSLNASREYARGKWWNIFIRIVFMILLLMLASILSSIIFFNILPIPFSIAQILNVFLTVFLMPLAMSYFFFLYKSVRSQSVSIWKNN